MLGKIDYFLDRTSMYRLVLYFLCVISLAAIVLSYFHLLPFKGISILISLGIFILLCYLFNKIFSWLFRVQTNVESFYITAFILSLIITPLVDLRDGSFFLLALLASFFAMASKYILTIRRKHVFNPAAISVVLTALLFHQYASWWVGNPALLPVVFVGGILIVRKIRRADLVISFLVVALLALLSYHFQPSTFLSNLWNALAYSPLFFFAFVMLTEPQTSPPTRALRIYYGALVGLLFSPFIHIGNVYFTPELALLAGNIFSYIVSPKEKLILKLKEKIQVAKDTFSFIFPLGNKLDFQPGQYLEWTLGHSPSDSRGNRRYFTITSSPTEDDLIIGVKFYDKGSTFKNKLFSLKEGEQAIAASRAGDFVLPKDKNKKLVFIAGGIGVTPFRSMIKYLLDKKEKRPIVLLYSNRTAEDVAYKDIFEEGERDLGIKTVYVITEDQGFIDDELIKKEVPDFKERTFYLSGPQPMIVSFDRILKHMGVSELNIKKDFFPGYA